MKTLCPLKKHQSYVVVLIVEFGQIGVIEQTMQFEFKGKQVPNKTGNSNFWIISLSILLISGSIVAVGYCVKKRWAFPWIRVMKYYLNFSWIITIDHNLIINILVRIRYRTVNRGESMMIQTWENLEGYNASSLNIYTTEFMSRLVVRSKHFWR